jgi:acetyltransferase-like isoleucine patch superfamily enzyme
MKKTQIFKTTLADLRLYICNFIVSKTPSHVFRDGFYRHVMKFTIHPSAAILLDVRFSNTVSFEMGANSVINEGCRLRNGGGIKIGQNVCVSPWVKLLTADHDVQSVTFAGRIRPIVIEDYAFIGAGAIILGGVRIGEGAVVSAGSVVTRSVDAYSIVAGAPAHQIGQRHRGLKYTLNYKRLFH